jgi:hypothetical protein
MPSWDLFEQQSAAYRESKALQGKFGFDPASILKVAREMLSSS